MVDVSDAVGAPTVITLGGKDYSLVPLTDEDFGRFERWLRSRELRISAELAEDAVDDAQREQIKTQGIDRAAELHLNSRRGLQLMASFEGSTYLLWLNLRKSHPDIQLEQVRKLCQDPLAMDKAYDVIHSMNFDQGKKQEASLTNTSD